MTRLETCLAGIVAGVLVAQLLGCGSSPPPRAPALNDDQDPTSRRALGPGAYDGDHDEGGSGDMEIEGLSGRLEVYDIQRGIEPHSQALSDCYATKITRKNRFISGEVELKFVVGRDGTVKLVHLVQSDLGSWMMESCMLEIARAMRFARPKGHGDADFTVPLSFTSRAPLAVWEPARAQGEVGADKLAQLAACATETGTVDPQGIWITVYVGTRGRVQSVGFASPGGPLESVWVECAAARVALWSLSDPRGQIAKASFQYNPE